MDSVWKAAFVAESNYALIKTQSIGLYVLN